MAKPKFSVIVDSFEDVTRINALLSGGAVTGVATGGVTPPAAPSPPVPVPVAAPVAPPVPVAAPAAPPAAPPPPVAAPAAPVAPLVPAVGTGGPSLASITQLMSTKIGTAGNPPQIMALLAQYNAKSPGKQGTVNDIDPAQYGNFETALNALP